MIRLLDPRRNHAEHSRRHVQFGCEADFIILKVSRLLNRDVHLEPKLLAQNKHLPNSERLNSCRRNAQGERNRRGDLRSNPRVNRSRRQSVLPAIMGVERDGWRPNHRSQLKERTQWLDLVSG